MKNRNTTRANIRKHKQAQKDLETTYLNEQQNYMQSQLDKIQNASENSLHQHGKPYMELQEEKNQQRPK